MFIGPTQMKSLVHPRTQGLPTQHDHVMVCAGVAISWTATCLILLRCHVCKESPQQGRIRFVGRGHRLPRGIPRLSTYRGTHVSKDPKPVSSPYHSPHEPRQGQLQGSVGQARCRNVFFPSRIQILIFQYSLMMFD